MCFTKKNSDYEKSGGLEIIWKMFQAGIIQSQESQIQSRGSHDNSALCERGEERKKKNPFLLNN